MPRRKPVLSEVEGRLSQRTTQTPRASAAHRPRPNTKRIGELAESAFLHAAQLRQIRVAKPWGDSERYDFIVDAGSRFWRVQIKATATLVAGGYEVQAIYCDGKRKGHLTSGDIDLLAAYVLPLDVWYFVPADALPPSASLRLYPHRRARHARFEQYRDAWHYLLPDPQQLQRRPGMVSLRTLRPTPETQDLTPETRNLKLETSFRWPRFASALWTLTWDDHEPDLCFPRSSHASRYSR